MHSRQPLFYEDDKGTETEERWPSRYWDFARIIYDAEMQMALRSAFKKLSAQDRYFLEKRNGICMTCGHVKKRKECLTYDKLGAKYNITTEEGARLSPLLETPKSRNPQSLYNPSRFEICTHKLEKGVCTYTFQHKKSSQSIRP